MKLGFIGTGHITTAIVTGLLTAPRPPRRVIVSPRNAAHAAALAARFPRVAVADGNQQVVDACDRLFLAVRPQVAREVLRSLRFRPEQRVVSLIAAISVAEIGHLVAPATAILRAVPLPSVARHLGPIAMYPPDPGIAEIFARIGTAVEVAEERQFDALWAVTALIAPYYALLGRTSTWAAAAGLDAGLANRYLGALFHALAVDAVATGERGFAALTEAAQTPGGLNEQALRQLSEAGWYDALAEALDGILARIAGSAAVPSRSDTAD